jgi:hypothetical protein
MKTVHDALQRGIAPGRRIAKRLIRKGHALAWTLRNSA